MSTPQVPAYLQRMLREACTTDATLVRRCQRHLFDVWTGLAEYTGSPTRTAGRPAVPSTLDSQMQWEDVIHPSILQRWYTSWCKGQDGRRQRWVRYTLNRLSGVRVQHSTRTRQTKTLKVRLSHARPRAPASDAGPAPSRRG